MNINVQQLVNLVPVGLRYGPLFYTALKEDGPGIEVVVSEVWAAVKAARNADGSFNAFELFPLLMTYGPIVTKYAQKEGVIIEHFYNDLKLAWEGKPLSSPVSITVSSTPAATVTPPIAGVASYAGAPVGSTTTFPGLAPGSPASGPDVVFDKQS